MEGRQGTAPAAPLLVPLYSLLVSSVVARVLSCTVLQGPCRKVQPSASSASGGNGARELSSSLGLSRLLRFAACGAHKAGKGLLVTIR